MTTLCPTSPLPDGFSRRAVAINRFVASVYIHMYSVHYNGIGAGVGVVGARRWQEYPVRFRRCEMELRI